MEMVGAALLLGFAAIAAGRLEDAAEHKNQVEANSGSEPPSKPHENGASGAGPERKVSGEDGAKEDRAAVHSTDSGGAKSAGTPSNAEAAKKTAARIDPNAVLKVEIRISKNQRRSKGRVPQPRSNSSKQGTGGKAAAETGKSSGDTHKQSGSQAKAAQDKQDVRASSVSYPNGESAGGRVPAKKQVIEVAPPEPSRPASAVQAVSVAIPHPAAGGDLKHLESFEGGLSVLCIVSRNINLVKEKIRRKDSFGRVRSVLVLRSEDGSMRDYWGRLRFNETGGVYVDETGFYEGKVASSASEVLQSGRLTKNGFYQSKDLPDKEVEKDFQTTKFLLDAIARERGTSVSQMASENCDLPLVDKLLFARRYAYRPAPRKETVCICADGLCKKPCKEIKQVDARKLE